MERRLRVVAVSALLVAIAVIVYGVWLLFCGRESGSTGTSRNPVSSPATSIASTSVGRGKETMPPDNPLGDTVARSLSAEAQRLIPVMPLGGRERLLQTLRRESMNDSLGKIPDFDDVVWVMGTMNGNNLTSLESYRYNRLFIPRLNRVRKVLEEARSGGVPPVARLQEMLATACDGFEEVEKAWNKEVALSPTGGVSRDGPNEYDRRTQNAAAAAYLLGELGGFKALPLMARLYMSKESTPVSRLYLFYASHLLVGEHPRTGLSPEAASALDAYLQASAKLPPPEKTEAPSWRSLYEETDVRQTIAGRDIGLANQPKISIRIYPAQLGELENLDGIHDKSIDDLFAQLDRFVKLAYPGME
jgi:hypothetical protein